MARQSKLQRFPWQIGEAIFRRGKLAKPVLWTGKMAKKLALGTSLVATKNGACSTAVQMMIGIIECEQLPHVADSIVSCSEVALVVHVKIDRWMCQSGTVLIEIWMSKVAGLAALPGSGYQSLCFYILDVEAPRELWNVPAHNHDEQTVKKRVNLNLKIQSLPYESQLKMQYFGSP